MIGNKQIAFLGLGTMGAPMTANLVTRGYAVKGWNRTPNSPGATLANLAGVAVVASLKEAVESAEIVFTCVGDIPDLEEVILGENGVVKFAPPGALIVDFSTIGSKAAKQMGKDLDKYNLRFLDAPVSGGDLGAQNGTLTIMVGGNPEDFAECKPLLHAMGKNIFFCGPIGSGQAVKLCNQVLVALYMVGLCEAMKMAEIQDIDRNLMIEVCSTGAAGSWALSNLGPKIVNSDFAPGFMIQHIIKDLRIVRETVQNADRNLPGIELAEKLFKAVQQLDNGEGGKQGTQAMIRAYNQGEKNNDHR
jgi:3-hydroxyisobutyrate dehydrogenase